MRHIRHFVLLALAVAVTPAVVRAADLPPTVPENLFPQNGTLNTPISVTLKWGCNDPEGHPLDYDVYFGTDEPLPLVTSLSVQTEYVVQGLAHLTVYSWRIVARDVIGQETTGPTSSFTTTLNTPPGIPDWVSPVPGETGLPLSTTLHWTASDPDNQPLTYDVYFGTAASPPLVASNVTTNEYDPGPQSYETKYWWRIVARDPDGATKSGELWAYTTMSDPQAPTIPVNLVPYDGLPFTVNAMLRWSATDPQGEPLNYDVYFGTAANPPLVADHIASTVYDPGPLAISTTYRWRIIARDASGHERSGAVWFFVTAGTTNLPPNVPSNPGPVDHGIPGDNPLLTWDGGDIDSPLVTYTVFMTTSTIDADHTWDDYTVGSTSQPHLQVGPLIRGEHYYWTLKATDGVWTVQSPVWQFTVSDNGMPVLFSKFEATPSRSGVEISWELASDEAIDGYSLYRREGSSPPLIVREGAVNGPGDSYMDRGVEAGRTYRYQLVVHASGGNEFRSQQATVTMPAQALTLHQNTPNPFNPQTTIRYDLPTGSTRVQLSIFDATGRSVRRLVDEVQSGGSRSAIWNGRDDGGNVVSSGVYFYVLDAGKERLTRKLVLLK